MAYLSKEYVQNVLESCDCREIVHPWNSSCLYATTELAVSCLKGSAGFFLFAHGAQFLIRLRNKKEINTRQIIKNFLKSICFALSCTTSFVVLNCLFRQLFGKVKYHMWFYVIPFCNGLAIFFETPERRELSATSFVAMALEGFYKRLINRKVIARSKKLETILFMITNGFLMFLLRVRQSLRGKKDGVWFLTPPPLKHGDHSKNVSLNSSSNVCPHENSCLDNCVKDTMKYGSIGLLMSGIRFLISKFTSPLNQRSFFQWNTLQLPIFIMLYVFIFKAMSCYLCRTEGKDRFEFTFLSGLIAGASYWFSPNITFLFAAMSVLFKICGRQIKESYKVPDLPYTELSFVLSNMFLLQLSALDFESLPKFYVTLIYYASSKKGFLLAEIVRKKLKI